jgi:CheY-like chemotaxis protein
VINATREVLLVENEERWQISITAALKRAGVRDVVCYTTYTEADRELKTIDLDRFQFAILDVRLRKQLFDQAGLALLHRVKARAPLLPVLVLTAYSDDYPGIEKVTTRYSKVMAYDKDVFLNSPGPILDALLREVPPQLGQPPAPVGWRGGTPQAGGLAPVESPPSGSNTTVISGVLCVILILLAGLGCFVLMEKFSQFSVQGNVLFALIVVCLMSVLLIVFGRRTVEAALRSTKDWLGNVFRP